MTRQIKWKDEARAEGGRYEIIVLFKVSNDLSVKVTFKPKGRDGAKRDGGGEFQPKGKVSA